MNPEVLSTDSKSEAVPLHSRAEDNLRFIRETMEGAASFTSISGPGLLGAGIIGVAASLLNAVYGNLDQVVLWLGALLLAGSISTAMTAYKARLEGTTLWSASGRKLLYAFCPTMFVGGIITFYLAFTPMAELLPALWLSLYGAAIMTAGAHSVIVIRVLGVFAILFGAIAFAAPQLSILMLGLGFGGLHIISGLIVWKYYGG